MPDEKVATEMKTKNLNTGALPTRRSANYQNIYINNSAFSMNPFDFSFTLNEITQNERGEAFVEQKGRVVMPPLHAKIFAMVFFQNIENYENQFGEIKVPNALINIRQESPSPAPDAE